MDENVVVAIMVGTLFAVFCIYIDKRISKLEKIFSQDSSDEESSSSENDSGDEEILEKESLKNDSSENESLEDMLNEKVENDASFEDDVEKQSSSSEDETEDEEISDFKNTLKFLEGQEFNKVRVSLKEMGYNLMKWWRTADATKHNFKKALENKIVYAKVDQDNIVEKFILSK